MSVIQQQLERAADVVGSINNVTQAPALPPIKNVIPMPTLGSPPPLTSCSDIPRLPSKLRHLILVAACRAVGSRQVRMYKKDQSPKHSLTCTLLTRTKYIYICHPPLHSALCLYIACTLCVYSMVGHTYRLTSKEHWPILLSFSFFFFPI